MKQGRPDYLGFRQGSYGATSETKEKRRGVKKKQG